MMRRVVMHVIDCACGSLHPVREVEPGRWLTACADVATHTTAQVAKSSCREIVQWVPVQGAAKATGGDG